MKKRQKVMSIIGQGGRKVGDEATTDWLIPEYAVGRSGNRADARQS